VIPHSPRGKYVIVTDAGDASTAHDGDGITPDGYRVPDRPRSGPVNNEMKIPMTAVKLTSRY
jgi:hypothetical protein